jgi:hypothetical protein
MPKSKINQQELASFSIENGLKLPVSDSKTHQEIYKITEVDKSEQTIEDVVAKKEEKVGIAPCRIKESNQLKKPHDKEPSIIKFFSDKVKGNRNRKN